MSLFSRLRTSARKGDTPSAVVAAPAPDAISLISEGNALEDQGQFQDALALYDKAAGLEPKLARVHLNRGNALLALRDPFAATEAYETALLHDPAYAAAHYNLGNAYAQMNRRDDSLGAYR